MVTAVKRFIVNNAYGGEGPPLPAGVGADQNQSLLTGPSTPTPLQPPVPPAPLGTSPLNVPIPHVSTYNTAQCPPGYYRSGGICVPIEQPGLTRGGKGSIQRVQIDPQTTPGAMFLIRILVTNVGTMAAQFSAKVTIPAINVTAMPTAGSALEPGQSVVIHKQIEMPVTAPPGQLYPATIELIRTDANNTVVTDDTEQSTVPGPGVVIPEVGTSPMA